MTTKPLQDIIEGKVGEFEDELRGTGRFNPNEPIYGEENQRHIKEHQDWLRTALKEAIIEGIEAVVPHEVPERNIKEAENNGLYIPAAEFHTINKIRAHILQSLQAIKESS